MKKKQCRFGFFSLKLLLIFIPFFSSNPVIYSLNVNDFIPSYEMKTHFDNMDTVICREQPDDTLPGIARFDHSGSGFNFFYLRLHLFHAEFERLDFYEQARVHEIYINDKNDFHSDSALFRTALDKAQAQIELHELYQHALISNASNDEMDKRNIIRASPFFKGVSPDGLLNIPLGGENECSSAKVSCSGNVYSFPSGTTGYAPDPLNGYPNYGCFGPSAGHYAPGPAWFYMQVGSAGDITINIAQSGNQDVDFICWGPFNSLTDGCASGLNGTCSNDPLKPPDCCDNNAPSCTGFYPRGNITDCSWSGSATETCHILNAQVGEIYILLLSNWSGNAGTITFAQDPTSTGVTSCNIVVFCSMIAITANPTACNELTNTFTVAGNIEFSNPSPTGTLTITDNTAVPPISQTLNAPFISPLPYHLANIPCDGTAHSITAVFSDSTNCNLTQHFTAPPASCPQALIGGGGTICNDGIQQAIVTVTFVGAPPFRFVYEFNGVQQPPVTHNSTDPYQIPAAAGIYTLFSLENDVCTGTVSGIATVVVNPLPTAILSGTAAVCQQSTSPGITFTGGSATPPYTFTYNINGGTAYTVTTSTGNTVTVMVSTFTPGTFTYNLVSVHDGSSTACSQLQPGSATVTVYPSPTATIAGTTTVCQHSTPPLITFTGGSSAAPFSFTYNINGGADQTINTTSGNSVTVAVPTDAAGVFTYNLLRVQDGSSLGCSQSQAGIAIVTILPVPVSSFTGDTTVCLPHSGPFQYRAGGGPACTYNWTINPPATGSIVDAGVSPAEITWNNPGVSAILELNATITETGCHSNFSQRITINPIPYVAIKPCFDQITSRSAKPFILRGGNPWSASLPQQGEYLVDPPTAALSFSNGNYYFDPSLVPGNDQITFTITYKYTSLVNCPATTVASVPLTVRGINPPCGDMMTDYRDSPPTVYRTALFAGRCWMTENLRFGATLSSLSLQQTDNCIGEKFCLPADDANCTAYGGMYQWDELIQYHQTNAPFQGMCPAGWHVPDIGEWQGLINSLVSIAPGDGSAGSTLKDPISTPGFHALLDGIYYLNTFWAFNANTPAATMFWTSSVVNDKAIARGLNTINPSVSMYESAKANAFPVRCIMD